MLTPKRTHAIAKTCLPIGAAIALLTLPIGLYLALFWSPPDYQQGNWVRFLYFHAPSAWFSLMIYGFMSLQAFVYTVWRLPISFLMLMAAAPLGLVLTGITLVTGMIWGQATWGTAWVWDARLTSYLVQFLFYSLIILLYRQNRTSYYGTHVVCALTLLGALNLPIIKWSVHFWSTLHQKPSLTSLTRLKDPAINTAMLWPLGTMALAFLGILLALFCWRLIRLMAQQKRPSL
jgi:heme exporter protein C